MSEPVLIPQKISSFIANDSVDLAVAIKDDDYEPIQSIGAACGTNRQDRILDVSASVIRPQDFDQHNEQGVETNESFLIKDIDRDENGKWTTRFSEFNETGDYRFIFKGQYKVRGVTKTVSALPITINFQSCQTNASYDIDTQILHLPAIKIENELYQTDYVLISMDPITLELNSKTLINDIDSDCTSYFDSNTSILHIPAVDIPNDEGRIDTYNAMLKATNTQQFVLDSLILQ